MSSGARLRSANQAFGRSRSGAFLITFAAPTPDFPRAWLHPCHGEIRESGAFPLGCSYEILCPGLPDPGPFDGDHRYIADWCQMFTNLNPRHLPINLFVNEGDTPFATIPASPCNDEDVFIGNNWVDGNVVYTLYNEDPQSDGGCPKTVGTPENPDAAVFQLCSEGALSGWPAAGTLIGMELTEVRDIILEFDGVGNRFRVDPGLYYAPGDQVYLLGTGGNDGPAIVTAYADPWVTVDRTLGQIPATGASLLVAGRWQFCGSYTLTESPPFGLYEVLMFVGTGDDPGFADGPILLYGTQGGLYDGQQTGDYVAACDCLRLPALYQGDALGGNWVNDVSHFIKDAGYGWGAFTVFSVRITSANYTGEYTDVFALDDNTIEIADVFAEFDESGTIERSGIQANITGGTGLRGINVEIQGTGLYDGVTTAQLDGANGTLRLFGFGDIWFIGDAMGTWAEIGGNAESGTIESVEQDFPPTTFDRVQPERGGEIVDIVSAVTRVTALAHGLDEFVGLGSPFFLWNAPETPPATATLETSIRAIIDGDVVDLEGRPPTPGYSGQWTSGYF